MTRSSSSPVHHQQLRKRATFAENGTWIRSKYAFKMTVGYAILTMFLAGWFPGCERAQRRNENHETTRLTLLCGGALRPPIDGLDDPGEQGILARFRSKYPEVAVETSYGASNLLLGQLKLTQAGDLFFPGDDFYIQEAQNEGLVYATRTVARFVPVILVSRGNPLEIRAVSDLAAAHVRLAVADRRAAAIGRITPEIFEKNGVSFDRLDNIVFTGVTAPEVAQAVALGHADATITWRPVAVQYPQDGTLIEIPPEDNVFSELVIAVLETSGDKEAGLMFADFIAGPEGRKVFQRYHYDAN
jgi:molybdate transport system substrate-binding protein